MTPVLYLLLSLLLSSLITCSALIRAARAGSDQAVTIFLMSFGIGPALLSWLLVFLIRIVPHQVDGFYIAVIISIFVAIAFYGRKEHRAILDVMSGAGRFLHHIIEKGRFFEQFLFLLLLAVIASNLFLAIFIPLSENDAIQYAVVSKMIYLYKSVSFYPVVEPDPNTGFYAVSSHPLGFMGLYFWAFLIQGGVKTVNIISLVTPYYVFATILALLAACRGRPLVVFFFSVILLLVTPAYYIQSSQLSIDAFRIYLMFSAFLWIVYLADKTDRPLSLLMATAVVLAMSMQAHSMGLLFTLPFLLPIMFVLMKGELSGRIKDVLIIATVATLVGGWRMFENVAMYGTPVYDFLPVYNLPSIHYDEYVWYGNGLLTGWDRVVRGLLRGFTNLKGFGFSYWLFLGFLYFSVRYWLENRFDISGSGLESAVVLFVAGFMFTSALTLALGMHVMVAGDRYMLTAQPLIAFGGGIFLGKIYGSLSKT